MLALIYIALIIFVFLSVYLAILKLNLNQGLKVQQSLIAYLKGKRGVFSYERIEKYLKYRGNPFELTPITYLITRFLLAGTFFVLFVKGFDSYMLGTIGTVVGFFLNDILMYLKDKEDMEKITFEFRDVYDLLIIQNESGIFIGDTLTEAYRLVSNKRLKKALARLSAEISITRDISKALANFGTNFKSTEIDNFIMVCEQSLQTGQSKKALNAMAKEISKMNVITLQEEREKIKDVAKGVLMLMFIGIIITVLYIALGGLSNNIHGLVSG